MPYIKKEQREDLDVIVDILITKLTKDLKEGKITEKDLAGNLTYVVFKLIRYFYENGKWYDRMDALKVCDSASDEFRRRFIHPYENKKIKENGDVKY